MSRAVLGIRPPMWNVDRSLVAPEWRWAWDGLVGAWMFWEGGNPPRDIVNGVPSVFGSTVPTRSPTQHGMGLLTNRVNNEGAEIDPSFDIIGKWPIQTSGTEGTIIALSDTSTNNLQSMFGNRNSDNTGWRVGFVADNSLWLLFSGVANYSVVIPAQYASTNLPLVWGWSFRSGDIFRGFVNGERIVGDTSIAAGKVVTAVLPVGLMAAYSSTALVNSMLRTTVCVLAYDRFLSDAEHAALGRDLFGPFRMEDIAPWATVAVPGVSQAFRYPYHKSLRTTLAG
ncbi:hypothetical protein LCGC14_0337840 [marine sediment metagenome]|uniref:Uncharacterized protein n=1 Tax=marine sediment metagenome TaxID=412755 RepID=A0A0F9TED4_9ZZZZ